MKVFNTSFTLQSEGCTEISDITKMVREAIQQFPVSAGIALINTLHTTCAVTSNGTFRWGTLIDRSMGVPGGTTSAMRMESPPEPTVLVARDAISSGARMSTSSSASARKC